MSNHSSSSDEFSSALEEHALLFGIRLSQQTSARLRDYYEQVISWNTRLHLVAPCAPAEFATRHVLESLLALPYLVEGACVVDIGSGAGLPIIPCLIVRPDLRATLIEASQKKTVFLREALRSVEAHSRAKIIAERFEETPEPEADALTCRALDRFTELFPKLFEWSSGVKTLLLFGGESLREQLEKSVSNYQAIRVPESERRFLFIVSHRTQAHGQQKK